VVNEVDMKALKPSQFEGIAQRVGDTPFTATPYFFLKRGCCQVYADRAEQPRYGAIVPCVPCPDVYLFGASSLLAAEVEHLADFLVGLEATCSLFVPARLVQPIRARRRVLVEVEGLCFTYRKVRQRFTISRPGFARQLGTSDEDLIAALPVEAAFLHQNFGGIAHLLAEGVAFGVVRDGKLASLATSLTMTPGHCEVGAYTVPRSRHLGYATDCVEAIFAHAMEGGRRPLWRIGNRQKVAIYFAEKLKMDEIGTDGQEVYIQMAPGE
jgi:hypothetical protein